MIECAKSRQLAAVALARDASEKQRRDLDGHLAECETCRTAWEALTATANAVRSAAPAAIETGADLVARALAEVGPPPARPRRRVLAARLAWVLALLAAMCAGAAVHFRPGREQGLLAVVEAAMTTEPAHTVAVMYNDLTGERVGEAESWRTPNGDLAVVSRDPGGRAYRMVERAEGKVALCWDEGSDKVGVEWTPRDPLPPGASSTPDAAGKLPPGVPEDARRTVRWMEALKARIETSERRDALDGEEVRVVTVTAQLLARHALRNGANPRCAMGLECWLTRDGKRLRRMVYRLTPDGQTRLRTETRLIEYDVAVPASAFELPPSGSGAAKGVFRDQPVELVWETMSDSERQVLRTAFNRWARAWCEGDAEEFLRQCDTEAGLQYGLKGKFTASEIRKDLARMATEQPKRWPQHTLTMDYAFGTSSPPAWAMQFWSIYRTGTPVGPGWLQYRLVPSTEPGIEVLARERVVGPDGKAQELGTMLFMKRIDGEYKVLLWAPPFG
jgi:hypothetical protein